MQLSILRTQDAQLPIAVRLTIEAHRCLRCGCLWRFIEFKEKGLPMLRETRATLRFGYQNRLYVVTAYFSSNNVFMYKVQREEDDDSITPGAYYIEVHMKKNSPFMPKHDAWNMDQIPALIEEYEKYVITPQQHFNIESTIGDLHVYLEVQSRTEKQTELGSYLQMRALEFLIEQADVTDWDNPENEIGSFEFCAVLLEAIAHQYIQSLPTMDFSRTSYDVLKSLIDELRKKGRLGSMS